MSNQSPEPESRTTLERMLAKFVEEAGNQQGLGLSPHLLSKFLDNAKLPNQTNRSSGAESESRFQQWLKKEGWLQSRLRTKSIAWLLNNQDLHKQISIGAIILLVWFIPTVLYESKNRPGNNLPPELQRIDDSIKLAHSKADPFVRERFIQQEAKRLGISSDEYRKLYLIRKPGSETLPDVPTDNPSDWVVWFYQDLSRGQRLKVIGDGFVWGLKILPNLTILYVGFKFLQEIPQREKQAEDQKRLAKYQAWQVIHTAHGQKFSGARITALEDLLAQGEPLASLSLEPGVDLHGINLAGARLAGVNFEGINFSNANLERTKFYKSNLARAILTGANLKGANLEGANLEGANLKGANLEGANLKGANLEGTNLKEANLKGAILYVARLQRADLSRADLQEARLLEADFKEANLSYVDFTSAQIALTEDQIEDAYFCETKAPSRTYDSGGKVIMVSSGRILGNPSESYDEWLEKRYGKPEQQLPITLELQESPQEDIPQQEEQR